MRNFIRLTRKANAEPILLNLDWIESFQPHPGGGCCVNCHNPTSDQPVYWIVSETFDRVRLMFEFYEQVMN